MKLLNRSYSFRLLIGANIALLLVHIVAESRRHDLNWLQIGKRSPTSQMIIAAEGSAAMFCGLAVYERYYPSMVRMIRSKEMRHFLILLLLEVMVWCLYR